VLSPLRPALAPVEQVAIRLGTVDIDGRIYLAPSAGTFALVWFQLRLLQ
jgi:hypothetical protein